MSLAQRSAAWRPGRAPPSRSGTIICVDDQRTRRMAQNEALARRINDRIEYQHPRSGGPADTFICECVRVDCAGTLELTIAGYARTRSHPRRFVVLPGHEEPAVESTVEVYPGYVVVEKRGEAGRIAEVEARG
jgi:hypothetical protein